LGNHAGVTAELPLPSPPAGDDLLGPVERFWSVLSFRQKADLNKKPARLAPAGFSDFGCGERI
jgi:hypothetical protein